MRIIVLVFWLIFWSFGSVLLTRLSSNMFDLNELKSISIWFSQCPKCKKRLKIKNLIPLFSYIYQWWKCSFCKKEISTFYPILEILSWIVFLLTYLFIPFSWYLSLFFRLLINWLLLLVLVYDFKKYELHLPITVLVLILSLLVQFFNITGDYKIAFFSSISLFITFLAIYYISKLYVRYKYKKNLAWIWIWDLILSFVLWTLFSFIYLFNDIAFSSFNLNKIILLFVLISCIVWIIIRIINYFIQDNKKAKAEIKNSLNTKSQNIIPFLPAMIITYWILLFLSDSILKIIFP